MRKLVDVNRRRAVVALALLLVGGLLADAHAITPLERCLAGRAKAAGRYADCIQTALAKRPLNLGTGAVELGRCAATYTREYDKLRAKALLSPAPEVCDLPRFVDNGDGTVTDNLTALQWEKKRAMDLVANYTDVHDADNVYSWTAADGTTADGTAFTTFAPSLTRKAWVAATIGDYPISPRR